MYTVEIRHHTKNWRGGDLEDKLELIDTKIFKTRTAAKAFIESQLCKGRVKDTIRRYHKGDVPSNCFLFTEEKWQHENSGEEMQEYYQYTLKKTKVN